MQTIPRPFKIVVGTDFSECSDAAVRQALELAARRAPAEVHVVNVVQPYGPESDAIGLQEPTVQEASELLRTYVENRLAAFRLEQEPASQEPAIRAIPHVFSGKPASTISAFASDVEADLVVTGTHGRRGVSRLLLGSVAESLVRRAPCPVFVVRPKQPPSSKKPSLHATR